MENQLLTTNRKALTINLDDKIYGTFAEIGAGQEVARHFFQAGAASRTIAKTISAYDMSFSDEIYGKSPRYVSRERLSAMLDHEYHLLHERLASSRGPTTRFFAFADTVATKSYGTKEDGQGWLGIRFQQEVGGEPNDILLHCRLLDEEIIQQQETIGILGVNLVFGAFQHHSEPETLIGSLFDHLNPGRLEINMIHFAGPAFAETDNRLMALQLVKQGHTRAVIFNPSGKPVQPSEALYKKPVLVARGSFRPITKVNLDMMTSARQQFVKDPRVQGQEPVVVMEITMNNLLAEGKVDPGDFLARVDILNALGFHVIISAYPEYYRLATFFRRYTREKIGIAMGINNLLEIFKEKYYEQLDGGLLEAFGRLFKTTVKLYIYPMQRQALSYYRRFSAVAQLLDKTGENGEGLDDMITADNLLVDDHLKHLYQHLRQNEYITAIENFDTNVMDIAGGRVMEQLNQNNPEWQSAVPPQAADIIKVRKLFGCKG
ncbi:MAG: TonB-dependent receptor [Opitutales bacterium]|nr:TonB-dependent receptor [Opitutales bacterium]MCH8539698.1 TonB-dependent receptor [Opitutales bacterium]